MAKLYPPYISGTLPAFCKENGDFYLEIPFSMNPGVGKGDISGFALIIKDILGSQIGEVLTCRYIDQAKFTITNNPFSEGQYYKFQLAYINKNNEIGYYSTIGIAKCILKPEIKIEGLENKLNMHQDEYLGVYRDTNKDFMPEKVYSYCFNVYDSYGNLYDTSGELIHNNSEDSGDEYSYDKFVLNKGLENNVSYYITYNVKTINDFTFSSPPKYRIMIKDSIDPIINATLQTEYNYENGYVDLSLVGVKDIESGLEEVTTGAFLLSRASDKDNFTTWEHVYKFTLSSERPSRLLWRDYTVEQGHIYKYGLQQYNDNKLYSNRMISEEVYTDFEDAFLFDGERQLKIKYNPKISSFKTTVLESKMDTIGSKHPFIFRNGSTSYKEFPISGLVSYYMDEENIFSKNPEGLNKTTDLISENIKNERQFKLSVLDWLNDGKVKLFRSPSEGNYIVRLMGVSMDPNDTLGRMLHNFKCTAYEMADFNYKEMNKYNLIQVDEPQTTYLHFKTVELATLASEEEISNWIDDQYIQWPNNSQLKYIIKNSFKYKINEVALGPIKSVQFTNMIPGDAIYIESPDIIGNDIYTDHFENGKKYQKIVIGSTGSYLIDNGMNIVSIYIDPNSPVRGTMTYSYYTTVSNIFDKIYNIENEDIPDHQFIGKHNILNEIENVNTTFIKLHSIKARKRNIQIVYFNEDKFYCDMNLQIQMPISWDQENNKYIYNNEYDFFQLDFFALYERKQLINGEWKSTDYIDIYNQIQYALDEYDSSFIINDQEFDLSTIEYYEKNNIGKINNLISSMGIILECTYQIKILSYNYEKESPIKENYENYLSSYNKWINLENEYIQDDFIKDAFEQVLEETKNNYNIYINSLTEKMEAEKNELFIG